MTPAATQPTALLLILSAAGLLVSLLSALENRVEWIGRFCALFGSGCRRTAEFTLLRLPVALWGGVFYVVLAVAALAAEPLIFWLVMAGLGFELTFVLILVTTRTFCIFCALNALVVAALAVTVHEPGLFWQAAAVALFFHVFSGLALAVENRGELDQGGALEEDSILYGAVAARVGEREIMEWEIERPLIQDIYLLQMEVHRLKREMAESFVWEELLRQEAAARGIPVKELVQERALCGLKSDDEECRKRIDRFADELADKYAVEFFLSPPPLPCVRIDVSGRPAKGPEDAEVVVVEFSDYLCPACCNAHRAVKEMEKRFSSNVRWVFMNYPLPMHRGADEMAAAALCAHGQGRFWEYQDRMFQVEEFPGLDGLTAIAGELGLDAESFQRCLEEGEALDKVEDDVREGRRAGVQATPTYFVNGRMLRGLTDPDSLADLIEEERTRCARLKSGGSG